jgi:SNF2 family DNA or RNA helicase
MRQAYTPREYQGLITDFQLDVDRGKVFAGMGTGKTVSTLTAIQSRVLCGEDRPTLILAPLRVARSTWPAEVRKWRHLDGLDVLAIVGSEAERRLALRYDAPVYTCNYDNLPWLVEHFGERWPFGTVIADECTRLKGFRLKQGGRRARALGSVVHDKCDRYIGLTGTPASNGLQDLWGQMWMVDRGRRLGRTYEGFKQRWFQKSYDGHGLDPLPFAQEQIQEAIADVCLTIRTEDWFDLKEPIVNNIYVDLPPGARRLYKDLEKQMFIELAGDRTASAVNAAGRTNKCLQLANGAVYLDPSTEDDNAPKAKDWRAIHDAKLEALDSVIQEANGMPVLVAYEFKSDVARIMKAFPKARMLDANPATEREWNEGKIPILLAHPKSAGHGLNLQDGGNILVFFGHNWNLEEYLQIIERIGPVRQHQAGHDRSVFIHHIIARDTVDELVMARRETKRSVQDILLDALKKRKEK